MTVLPARYELLTVLGEGAQKTVYLVRDTALDRDCALSLIRTDILDPADVTRLRHEAQAMARLNHLNIVTIYDIGEHESRPYIVCEYVPGGDLRKELAAHGRVSRERAVQIAIDLADALAVAHDRSVIHRDLKPANVWLSEDGTAKLGDFGVAFALDRSRLTMTGVVMGTAAYMAPEQALGGHTDARTDLYALGCVLYEMVTGRPPFLGSPMAVISQHIRAAPIPPSQYDPKVGPDLQALILRLLAKEPAQRPATALVVGRELRAIANGDERASRRRSARSMPSRPDKAAKRPAAVSMPSADRDQRPGDIASSTAATAWVRPFQRIAETTRRRRAGWIASIAAATAIVVGGGIASVVVLRSHGAPTTPAASDPGQLSQAPAAPPVSETPERIAYVGSDGNLWTMNPDGSEKRQLTSDGAAEHPAWSPDGSRLVFVRRRGEANELWSWDADHGEQLVLAAVQYSIQGESHFATLRSPIWAPDGKAILYREQRESAATATVRRHLITDPARTDDQTDDTVLQRSSVPEADAEIAGFDVSPGQHLVAFEVCSVAGAACGIRTTAIDDLGAITSITNLVPLVAGQYSGLPAISPDGKTVAFYSNAGVATVRTADSKQTPLANASPELVRDDPFWPRLAWSPSGSQLCYETRDDRGVYVTSVWDFDSQQSRVLVEGRHPTWTR